MNQRVKYVQLFTEALIPLLGFFMWDWGLYFILLFYFIDITTDEVFSHLKSKKIVAFKMIRKNEWIKPAPKENRGVLAKYAKLVSSASEGAITDKF